jgi:hypothetical protein
VKKGNKVDSDIIKISVMLMKRMNKRNAFK